MTNRIYDALAQVKASEELKASTVEYLRTERQRRVGIEGQRPRLWSVGRLSAALCLFLLLGAGAGGYHVARTPVSYISIDVNPSIELALNRLDRVVSSAAYNEDGEIVLDGVSVKGKPYGEAIDSILESDAMAPYLSKDAALTFTVASYDGRKEETLQAGVRESHGCKNHGGRSVDADVELLDEAHGQGVSLGKYAAYLELAEYDDGITVEDCRKMTMSEIREQIHCHQREGAARDSSDSRKGVCGSGYGNDFESGHGNGYENRHKNGHENGHHGRAGD